MNSRKLYIVVVCLFVLNTQIEWSNGSLLDWIWPNRNAHLFGSDVQVNSLPVVPFELSETNDKFILDSSALLGTQMSDLDFCQQRVILAVKKSCNTLTDEELGKLSVALLNCQLIAEARDTYECSENMSLKDCTTHMTPELWNSYNHIQGRAKTTCLAIRQDQFRGLAEMTVNKLMSSAHQHLQLMNDLKGNQKILERATLASLDEITDNHLKLLEKQQEALQLADVQRLSTESNVREIMREKSMIRSGQIELNKFIASLREEIDQGLSGVQYQNIQSKEAYSALLGDLFQLNQIASKITGRLEEISEIIAEKNEETNSQFDETLSRLKETSAIVENFSKIVTELRDEFDRKLQLIEAFLGKDDLIERLSIISIHLVILLIGMICLVFINADILSRCMFLSAIAINLTGVLNQLIPLDLVLLIETIATLLGVHGFVQLVKKYNFHRHFVERLSKKAKSVPDQNGVETRLKREDSVQTRKEVLTSERHRLPMPITSTNSRTSTRILHSVDEAGDRASSERERSTSRLSNSSSNFNIGDGIRCKGLTLRGSRCQLTVTYPNNEFCYIHGRNSLDRGR